MCCIRVMSVCYIHTYQFGDDIVCVIEGRKPVGMTMCGCVRHGDGVNVSICVYHRDDDGDTILVDCQFKRCVNQEEITVRVDEIPGLWDDNC